MTNVVTGQQAETAAASYLELENFTVVDRNWKTRYCEIDIVAQKGTCIYFVEVKYRKTSQQGSGLDYITARKQGQMRFAAEMWVQAHAWRGDYALSAVEVTGPAFQITNFLPHCT